MRGGNRTGHLRPEEIRALQCDYCGNRWLITEGGMTLDDAVSELSLHAARVHGTINVALTPITEHGQPG